MIKAKENTKKENVNYEIKVLSAKAVKDGRAVFDMEVNGVKIYGCWFTEYTNKEGKEGTMVSFPSYKGTNGTYYSHAWFPISKEAREDIGKQIEKLLK